MKMKPSQELIVMALEDEYLDSLLKDKDIAKWILSEKLSALNNPHYIIKDSTRPFYDKLARELK